jgi:hypothetical protein
MALRRINVVAIDRLGLFALLEDWPPDERETENEMGKRVQATLALSYVKQADPKDTVKVTVEYGDMSMQSYQDMQKGIAGKLFEMGDAGLADALAAEPLPFPASPDGSLARRCARDHVGHRRAGRSCDRQSVHRIRVGAIPPQRTVGRERPNGTRNDCYDTPRR